jgi:hypothetical protein
MIETSTDVLWAQGFGTIVDIKKIFSRVKRFRKYGFYAVVDELTQHDRENLIETIKSGDESMVNNIQVSKKYIICPEQTIYKSSDVYHIRVYGPGPIKTQMKTPTHGKRNYMVLQFHATDQSIINCSVPMTLREARKSVESCSARICMIVKVVETRDRIAEEKARSLDRVAALANQLKLNTDKVDPLSLEKMIEYMESLCKPALAR